MDVYTFIVFQKKKKISEETRRKNEKYSRINRTRKSMNFYHKRLQSVNDVVSRLTESAIVNRHLSFHVN